MFEPRLSFLRSVAVGLVLQQACLFAQGFKFLEVKVVDPEGQPMADVAVEINIDGMKFPMPTDEKGIVSVNVPAGDTGTLELGVSHEGFAAVKARWAKGNPIPEQFTIPLKKGITIGGIVHDEQGQPIEGVTVEGIATAYNDHDNINGGRGELQPSIPRDLAVTDSSGRWENKSAPDEDVSLQLRFLHDHYVSDKGFGYRGGTWEELKQGDKIVVMEKGITLAGKVIDGDGQPISGAKIAVGAERYMSDRVVVTSDEDGKYQIGNMQPGTNILTVTAKGYAPDLKTASVHREMPAFDFQLASGNVVRMKVVDNAGLPVAGVRVIPDEWRGARSLDRSETLTDEQGVWQWYEAPSDEVEYGFYKSGHMGQKKLLTTSDEEQVITLPPAVVVNGTVVDKETKRPIDRFKYVEGVWWEPSYDRPVLQSMNVETASDGKFRFQMESACEKFCVRVEANGYRPMMSREILPDEGEIEIEFSLEPGSGPSGVVWTPEGEPAIGADVGMATPGNNQFVSNGRFQQHSQAFSIATDAEGKFTLPAPEGFCRIVVVHDTGWAELDLGAESGPLEIKLTPWSTVSVLSRRQREPIADERISLSSQNAYERDKPYVSWSYSATTDSAGKAKFARVKSGEVHISRVIPYAESGRGSWMSASSHGTSINVAPNSNATVPLGGRGRHIKGRLTVADDGREAIDWNMGAVQLNGNAAKAEMGNVFYAVGKLLAGTIASSRDAVSNPQSKNYAATIDSNGEFEIFDVAPGNYAIVVQVYPKDGPENNRWNAIATLRDSCVVPEGDQSEVVDLGSFEVRIEKP